MKKGRARVRAKKAPPAQQPLQHSPAPSTAEEEGADAAAGRTPLARDSPDSTKGILQLHDSAMAAAPPKPGSKKRKKAAASPAAAAAAAAGGSCESDDDAVDLGSAPAAGEPRGQTPSATTDAAMPSPAARRGKKQQQQQRTHKKKKGAAAPPAAAAATAAAAAGGAGDGPARKKRKTQRQPAAAAAAPAAAPPPGPPQQQQRLPRQGRLVDDGDGEDDEGPSEPSESPPPAGTSDTLEGEGSWLPPPQLPPAAAAAAAGGGGAAGLAAPPDSAAASLMHLWEPTRSKGNACLELQLVSQLGKGGFGSVHKVAVKARGANSLAELRLDGPLGTSLHAIMSSAKASAQAEAAAARARKRGAAAAAAAGAHGTVSMALKLALPFDRVSYEMQRNFKTAAVYDANVQARMRDEFRVMQACASSCHVVDAFALGWVFHCGAWRPAILLELCELGDAERAFIPASYWSPARGISATATQRIVRQAALGLRDLHKRAQSMHLDVKLSNLLVFGNLSSPLVKICDFGCAKKRRPDGQPRQYGPASGTKDWQAPEQMGSEGGPLDYSADSWSLGLLVLALRRGRQPWWWLKEQGRIPAEAATSLAGSLDSPSCPYAQDDASGTALSDTERAFVQTCMAAHSSSRSPPAQLLDEAPYLSARYRGG